MPDILCNKVNGEAMINNIQCRLCSIYVLCKLRYQLRKLEQIRKFIISLAHKCLNGVFSPFALVFTFFKKIRHITIYSTSIWTMLDQKDCFSHLNKASDVSVLLCVQLSISQYFYERCCQLHSLGWLKRNQYVWIEKFMMLQLKLQHVL